MHRATILASFPFVPMATPSGSLELFLAAFEPETRDAIFPPCRLCSSTAFGSGQRGKNSRNAPRMTASRREEPPPFTLEVPAPSLLLRPRRVARGSKGTTKQWIPPHQPASEPLASPCSFSRPKSQDFSRPHLSVPGPQSRLHASRSGWGNQRKTTWEARRSGAAHAPACVPRALLRAPRPGPHTGSVQA